MDHRRILNSEVAIDILAFLEADKVLNVLTDDSKLVFTSRSTAEEGVGIAISRGLTSIQLDDGFGDLFHTQFGCPCFKMSHEHHHVCIDALQ